MKKWYLMISAGMLILCHSCFYTETDIYFVDVVPGDPPVFSVSTNLDTIVDPVVSDSLEVIYEAEIENGEFYLVQSYLSDGFIFQSDSLQDAFWIHLEDEASPGLDTLYLYFYYSTNSNSLADLVKAEANIVQRKYPITFH
jgi:hypothetical protein